MPNRIPQILPELHAHRLEGLPAGDGVIFPYEAGFNLVNLPASICTWLGVTGLGSPPLDMRIMGAFPCPFKNVIFFLVDGLGLKMFQRLLNVPTTTNVHKIWKAILSGSLQAPLTSVVPSTTTAALTTLWTGRTPVEHGVIGYEVWLKEYSMIANMITHSAASYAGDTGGLTRAGFRPDNFLPVPTLGTHLSSCGITVHAFQHISIARSGLSTMLMSQVNVTPYRTQSDLWVSLRHLLDNPQSGRSYICIYWGDIDDLSHHHGPEDERIDLEFSTFSFQLDRFLADLGRQLTGETLLVLCADHGQIATPINPNYDINNHPEVFQALSILPSGESRLPYLFVHPGREEKLKEDMERIWEGEFQILPASTVLRAGLLGSPEPYYRTQDRIGDYVVFPQGNAYWWWSAKQNTLLGRHGGLSQEEMLVPLILLPL